MPKLTSSQRNNATGRLQAEATQQAVARHFGVSRRLRLNVLTLHHLAERLQWCQWMDTCQVEDCFVLR